MTREARGLVKVNVYVNAQVLAAMRRIAEVRGTAYAECMRDAIKRYVLEEGPRVLSEMQQVRDIAK